MDTLQVLWEGCDGSVWDLLDRNSPVAALSISGLGLPGFTNQFAEAAAVDGRRYEGTSWGSNTVSMTVMVGDQLVRGRRPRRGEEWRQLDAAWRASLSPERTGRLVVISGAGRRSLELRLDSPSSPPSDVNPALRGVARYDLTLTADDQPWWTGEEQTAEFVYVDRSQPFFGGAGGSTLLYISPASDLATAAIPNPGHRPSPPRWWARGPFGSLTVGIGQEVLTLPLQLIAGQEVHVDSAAQTIVDGQGGNLWPLLGYADATFPEIPPGELVPVRIEFTGAATGAVVGVGVFPRFDGPW